MRCSRRGGHGCSTCARRMNVQKLPRASSSPESPATHRLERGDARYPEELNALGDAAPELLFARGSLDILDVRPRVAIVGTRRCTAYGRRVTTAIATALARAGACIVSGLAT